MAKYQFIAADFLTGVIKDEVPLAGVKSTRILDRAGAMAATAPLLRARRVTYARPYSQTCRLEGPAGQWRLGERAGTTAQDISGNNRNGTYTGTFALGATSLLTNDTDPSLDVAGAGMVDVADTDAWSPSTTGALAVEAIVQLDTLPAAGQFRTIASKSQNSNHEWALRVDSAGRIFLQLWDSTGAVSRLALQGPTLVLGATYHVVAEIVDAGTCTLTVTSSTSTTVVTGTATGPTTNGTAPLRIGQRGTGVDWWDGRLDEVVVYPAVLGTDRVAAHAAAAFGQLEQINITYSPVSRGVLDPGRTVIYVIRDDIPIRAFVLWNARGTMSNNTLELSGEGLWSYWKRRGIRTRKTFAAIDQFTIASQLLTATAPSTLPAVLALAAIGTSGVARDRDYPAEQRTKTADAIEALAAVENGFDFDMVLDPTTWISTFRAYYPHLGVGAADTNIILDVALLDDLVVDSDASNLANVIDAIGGNVGNKTLIATAADAASLGTYPELWASTSYPTVSILSTLQAHAGRDLAMARRALDLPAVTFQPHGRPDLQIGAFAPGDHARVQGSEGWLDIDGIFRIVADELAIGPDADEKVTLTLAVPEIL